MSQRDQTLNELIIFTAQYTDRAPSTLAEETTLATLELCDPIGHGELLNYKDALEKHFQICFTNDELPGFFESVETTLGQIAQAVRVKVEQRVA